jgi:hypothetical protein
MQSVSMTMNVTNEIVSFDRASFLFQAEGLSGSPSCLDG